MIVREMGGGRLLCIPQPTHALMAAQFCRHWGNADFAAPQPYTPVMMAIAQHDNGWYEWELAPRLRADGFPMDFMTHTDQVEKTALWQRGINRVWAQHPYAALLVGRHASILYEQFLAQSAYDGKNERVVRAFLADQRQMLERARRLLGGDRDLLAAMQQETIEINTRLLQFGDHASLQVSVPWSAQTTLPHCPLDYSGATVEIRIVYNDCAITFDPWPYGVDQFEVTLEGYLIDGERFADEAGYHRALSEASFYRKTWNVMRNA
ncbi:MAG: DUF3891 family protein [Caldilineaceae bacterium]|nr:DUF3891 family protein [Caldilineaceae bacterium]